MGRLNWIPTAEVDFTGFTELPLGSRSMLETALRQILATGQSLSARFDQSSQIGGLKRAILKVSGIEIPMQTVERKGKTIRKPAVSIGDLYAKHETAGDLKLVAVINATMRSKTIERVNSDGSTTKFERDVRDVSYITVKPAEVEDTAQ